MSELEDYKSQMRAHITQEKQALDDFLEQRTKSFWNSLETKLTATFNSFLENFKKTVNADLQANRNEIVNLRAENDVLRSEVLKQKKGNLEQGVHDRKRDVMISDLEINDNETQSQLEAKICDNFVNTLGIPRSEVNKFVFKARHRLQKPRNGKPPKVIAVLLDLDHVNTVFTAARKKGAAGQHIQTHLPQELQMWKNRCLKERRRIIDGGCDRKDVRVRDYRGFSKLQVRQGDNFVDKLVYMVSLDEKVNFPDE